MKAEYICHSGDDLLVVNAARVSFDKHHDAFTLGDAGLIKYLVAHNHISPFFHPHITLRISVPIFIANQLKRHQVGFAINEISRRYIDTEPEFYNPCVFGKRAEDKKQGSIEGEVIPNDDWILHYIYKTALKGYNSLLELGVSPEDARMVLPLATYTSFYWTGSLYAYARMYKLRSQKDAQRQSREIAAMISNIIIQLFPISWGELSKNEPITNIR